MLPDLTPREKPLNSKRPPNAPLPPPDAKRRLEMLKRAYGDDYMIYPDTPGAAEFPSLSRSFAVLERIGTPEAKQFLETLAKRPAGDWFAAKATEALKRLRR